MRDQVHPRPRMLAFALALTVLPTLGGCGSTPATRPTVPAASAAGLAGPGLATSLSSTDGTSWAVVQMGRSASRFDSFWELFVRPARTAAWQLATPGGVASNGGLVMAQAGGGSLVAGFRPSQDLTFSPLAATANGGAQWSQNTLLSPGLGGVPDALAASPGGRLLALTDAGGVKIGARLGSSWTSLTTRRALGATAAGRACGLTTLTAAAWTPAGVPLVAGDCSKPGTAGIFTLSARAWHAAAPALPAAISPGPVAVLALATAGARTTAILAGGTGAATFVVAAWSADGGASWRLSPVLRRPALRNPALRAATAPSISIWADGSAGLVLPAGRAGTASIGVTIGWRAPGWTTLPALPAGTATLAAAPGGRPEALAAGSDRLSAWQLGTGASADRWILRQTVRVTIPYGSSG